MFIYIFMTNPCYTERIKIVCEDRRTMEFFSKFAWNSFIAFIEFLIHVNKYRGYESYKQKGLNFGASKHLLSKREVA